MSSLLLNLGCGYDIRASATNVDKRTLPGVDIVHDLDQFPWPFLGHTYDAIVAQDIFEHLTDVVKVMEECWRVLRAEGTLTIRGPLPDSPNVWVDVTHRRAFIEHSFDHFDPDTDFGKRYGYGAHKWRLVRETREGTNITFILTPRLEQPAIDMFSADRSRLSRRSARPEPS